jgi:ElaB/YqjD/DUF883 family membrane-anchored ribosome-binding protein
MTNGNDYEKAVDALLKDVKELRADMKGILGVLHGKARDYVEGVKESLHESGAEKAEQLRDAACAVGKKYHEGVKCCAEKIEERPFASVLVALGVGVILGGLMRRHRG